MKSLYKRNVEPKQEVTSFSLVSQQWNKSLPPAAVHTVAKLLAVAILLTLSGQSGEKVLFLVKVLM